MDHMRISGTEPSSVILSQNDFIKTNLQKRSLDYDFDYLLETSFSYFYILNENT